jgi:hypothetical protein
MKLLKYNRLLKASLLVLAFLIVPRILEAQINTLAEGNDDNERALLTPPGLYVTPTAPLSGAKQQPLNPGLASYPDYIAGEAVKAVVSPDGKILAILTAGFNSLFKAYVVGSPATVDTAASTQFIFLYDVSGPNKAHPA